MPESRQHFDAQNFDAIIVGARVAGTAAAIFLARQHRRVLLIDKASFPSDTISTHIVLSGGARVLGQLGVLEMLEQSGAVRFSRMRSIGPDFDYRGDLVHDGLDERGLCLSRIIMDAKMIEAARSFESIQFRDRLRVTDLIIENRAIAGIRAEDSTDRHEFRAPLTIGADGMRSTIARRGEEKLGAFPRIDVPCARAYYYAYFDGVDESRLGDELVTEFESSPGAGNLVCRCEQGRIVAATAFDAVELHSFRIDLEGNLRRYLDRSFAVGRILEGATLAGKVFSSGLLSNTCRDPAAAGALLLGDAGLHVDPLFGQGHSLALMSAAIVGDLAPQWFDASRGETIPAIALAEFTRRRDAELMPFYKASVRVSRELALDKGTRMAHRAAASEQWAADEMIRFAQMLTPRGSFPSFRFARLMAKASRAA
ncbi:MAG: FAD-dependent monooxygenase [Candidatus Binatus sp.]|uniref:NAD(P)/FAD-dependent oxidoreductase n=1 Tax=Candidatus Binatus sp. TaxID=2811406 RepID=UPI00271A1639|nr:FAD-dependent monooxygenase [Candidatus Binatus sp.]MDO8431972.1 FAD-dependent monooxygenase [Candidatus Binatus sp.]